MQDEVRQLIEELRHAVTRPWAVMEVCGGQTHAIASLGLEELLPPGLRLIHGPGCPVCVTAVELIDQAVELSLRPGVVLCSYGDMMRVPGSRGDLFPPRPVGETCFWYILRWKRSLMPEAIRIRKWCFSP